MGISYTIQDYVHFLRMHFRNQRRQKTWAKHYENSIRTGSFKLPYATVLQILPTEECNLRCPMCNQWGENGYFLSGARVAGHMPEDSLRTLLDEVSPVESMISIHGGEPFAFKSMDTLLEILQRKQFDVIFSTNGTLLDRYIEPLASVKNLALLFSIDGDEQTHDRIRGPGRFQQAKSSLNALFELRRSKRQPLPMTVMSFVVCEWNTDCIERAFDVAEELNVFALNYNMRWFLTEEIGLAYERHIEKFFGLKSTGAWRGWISNHTATDYSRPAESLKKMISKKRFRLKPPFVVTTPRNLQGDDFKTYYADYLEVFGNETCFMPFYWARIHTNGDLIYCPGHPDIIAGNVFQDGFLESFNSERSVQFRKHILSKRMPICNRCCGLYMTYPGRPHEQRVRRQLGLPREAMFDPQ